MAGIEQAALLAANRIMHGDGDEDDAQLVAGTLIQIVSSRPELVEMPTDAELDAYIESSTCECDALCECSDR